MAQIHTPIPTPENSFTGAGEFVVTLLTAIGRHRLDLDAAVLSREIAP